VRVIAREVGNLLNNFDVLGTFRTLFTGQANTCQTGPRDLATLTFNLGAHWCLSDMGHRASSVYQV